MKKLLASKLITFGAARNRRGSNMRKFSLASAACLIFAFCIAAAIASPAQTYTTLASFDGTDGADPVAGLVQGTDGNFYGTAFAGGTNNEGTVFKISPAGKLTTLYTFCSQPNCSDGALPNELMLATNGNLYGVTESGGIDQTGTIFEITSSGQFTTIYRFCSQPDCNDGVHPVGPLVQGRNGNLYGTTYQGGLNGVGTIFELTPASELTTLHTFDYVDGKYPSPLLQATNGNFYGTTQSGGPILDCPSPAGCGTVFETTPTGELTTVYTFCARTDCTDGSLPETGLVQASDGNLYGTTLGGGANRDCETYLDGYGWLFGCGAAFEMSLTGRLTTIDSFCAASCTDAANVFSLLPATDGNFYGTEDTLSGDGPGSIFELTPTGALTTLYNFCSQTNCTDGSGPAASLVQGTDGAFYGTTEAGGTYGVGVVFSLSVGLKPFVETTPTSGKVGGKVMILGNDLKGATRVAFNGTTATITSGSNTEITTTVPTGATTGAVEVMTASGKKLESNVFFQVIP